MNNTTRELIIVSVLLGIAILHVNPFNLWMPDMLVMTLLCLLLVLFGIYTAFIMREEIGDEREVLHRSLSGRNAYLAGVALLLIGILYEGIQHESNPWLVIALIGMVLTKLGTRIWCEQYK